LRHWKKSVKHTTLDSWKTLGAIVIGLMSTTVEQGYLHYLSV